MRVGVVVFPGSNCDHDTYHVLKHVCGCDARFVWHKDPDLGGLDAVVLPATEGDMTVLAGHSPVMTTLKTGFLVVTSTPGNGRRVLVRGGFADINQNGLTVLAERALPEEELTQEILDRVTNAVEEKK